MKLTRNLEFAAMLCGALLAGAGLDRIAVAMPAWRIVGASGWAAFSRHADLGNGRILYPGAAIGVFALSLAAAISYRQDQQISRKAGLPILLSVLLSAGGLALTNTGCPVHAEPASDRRRSSGFTARIRWL